MRVTDTSGVYHDGDAFVCPDCTTPYDSVYAAASCDCDSED